MYTYMYILAHW